MSPLFSKENPIPTNPDNNGDRARELQQFCRTVLSMTTEIILAAPSPRRLQAEIPLSNSSTLTLHASQDYETGIWTARYQENKPPHPRIFWNLNRGPKAQTPEEIFVIFDPRARKRLKTGVFFNGDPVKPGDNNWPDGLLGKSYQDLDNGWLATLYRKYVDNPVLD